MRLDKLIFEAEEILGWHWEDSPSPEEKERLLLAIDAMKFISVTGQLSEFEDYRKGMEESAPPLAIASFNTREEADAWMNASPRPRYPAYVLVAGEYHLVFDPPELKQHRLVRQEDRIDYYVACMIKEGLPAPVATFTTREEAETWVQNQPEPPRQVFIQIAGEYHLVVYHQRVNLRAIYPISRAAKLEPESEAKD